MDSSPPHPRVPALIKDTGELLLDLIGALTLVWLAIAFIAETAANAVRIKAATQLQYTGNKR